MSKESSKESDKDLVHRFFEVVWNQNSVEAAKAIVHEPNSSPPKLT